MQSLQNTSWLFQTGRKLTVDVSFDLWFSNESDGLLRSAGRRFIPVPMLTCQEQHFVAVRRNNFIPKELVIFCFVLI